MNEIVPEYIAETVAGLAEPILEELGLELVEVQFRREQVGWVLRLIIHRSTGVAVDDCARVSREISNLLDVEELIGQPYHLEVSSPGLDRPLKTAKDFLRHQGQKIKVVTNQPIEEQQVLIGLVAQVKENGVVLATERDRFDIPFDRIAKATLVIEF
jgi:ribosome maturation factor RimP